jgi:hypothetical protein
MVKLKHVGAISGVRVNVLGDFYDVACYIFFLCINFLMPLELCCIKLKCWSLGSFINSYSCCETVLHLRGQ